MWWDSNPEPVQSTVQGKLFFMKNNLKEHIRVENLEMAYGDFLIQRNINFSVAQGDIFIVMGGSGCGKSTLMRHMLALHKPVKGKVYYKDQSLWDVELDARNQILRKVGVLYQNGALWTSMTLGENLSLPLQEYTKLSKKQIEEIVNFKLSLVGLDGFSEFYPYELSGGMKKRAALARAMALDPDILFFDEPSSGLDPLSARRLDDLILELKDTLGTTIVIVTHDLASIFAIGNNSIFLDEETKTIIDSGDPKYLREHSLQDKVRTFLTRGQL